MLVCPELRAAPEAGFVAQVHLEGSCSTSGVGPYQGAKSEFEKPLSVMILKKLSN